MIWLGDRDRVATTGVSYLVFLVLKWESADVMQFSKMSDRQVGLWETGGLSNLEMTSLDSSA